MAKHEVNYTAEREAGLTHAREQNPEYVNDDNDAYLQFVADGWADSYVSGEGAAKIASIAEAAKLGDPAVLSDIEATSAKARAAIEADRAAKEAESPAAEEARV